jgi:hypothetical protein
MAHGLGKELEGLADSEGRVEGNLLRHVSNGASGNLVALGERGLAEYIQMASMQLQLSSNALRDVETCHIC